jgi:uncharacterized membrane protein YbhN (UPF0104 family)
LASTSIPFAFASYFHEKSDVSLNGRAVLRTCGLLFSAAALAWIGIRFAQNGGHALLKRIPIAPSQIVVVLVSAAIAYALALWVLAFAWWRLVTKLSTTKLPTRQIMASWAATQYGKYLPGNFAQYALRHAWSRRYGVSHAALGLASLLEAVLLLISALMLTLLADTRELRGLSMLDPRLALALLVALIVALGVAAQFAHRQKFVSRWHIPALPPTDTLVFCLACYATFFVIGAGLLDGLAHVLGFGVASFAMLVAASAASWAAGFIVIGAPGGLGVREVAFVALAGGSLGEDRALLLIGLFRIVTFLGDTLIFAAGVLALRGADRVIADSLQNHRSAP